MGNLETYHLQLVSEEGEQSHGTQPLTRGTCCYHQVHSVRIELNCRAPSWSHRELLSVVKKPADLVSEVLWMGEKCESKGKHRKSEFSLLSNKHYQSFSHSDRLTVFVDDVGPQCRTPQNMPQWHIDYFVLKLLKKSPIHEGHSDPPLHFPESRK